MSANDGVSFISKSLESNSFLFQTMRKQLLGKFRAEKDKMPPEKKTLVLTHFPRFLSLLEEEIYGANSPIWDPEFKQVNPLLGSLIKTYK